MPRITSTPLVYLLLSGGLFILSLGACNKNCQECTVKQTFSSSDNSIPGYPYDEERRSRYCDEEVDNLIQSQGAYNYEYTKPNGDKYTITEVLSVNCSK